MAFFGPIFFFDFLVKYSYIPKIIEIYLFLASGPVIHSGNYHMSSLGRFVLFSANDHIFFILLE